jgi:hypothetical protein
MRSEVWILILAVALVLGACGGDDKKSENPTEDVASEEVAQTDNVTDEDLDPENDTDPDEETTLVEVVKTTPDYPLFSGPEGVFVFGEYLFVTNTNGVWDNDAGKMVYGNGYITVLKTEDLSFVSQIETPFMNPQFITYVDEYFYVVCSGTVEFDENWTMTPASPGGIVMIGATTFLAEGSMEIPAGGVDPMAGFPGAVAYDAVGKRLFIGSGTYPAVYVIDSESLEMVKTLTVYPDAIGNDIIVPAFHDGVLYATSFNTGLTYGLNPDSGDTIAGPYDVTKTDELEGPTDVKVVGDVLYILNSMSSSVATLDLETGDVAFPFTTGSVPNRLAFDGDNMFVVNSGDNNLTRINIETGDTMNGFAVFDVGTNPWEMAVGDDFGYVTGYMSNSVFKVDLSAGETVLVKGNE